MSQRHWGLYPRDGLLSRLLVVKDAIAIGRTADEQRLRGQGDQQQARIWVLVVSGLCCKIVTHEVARVGCMLWQAPAFISPHMKGDSKTTLIP